MGTLEIKQSICAFAENENFQHCASELVKALGYFTPIGDALFTAEEFFQELIDQDSASADRREKMRQRFCSKVKNVYVVSQMTETQLVQNAGELFEGLDGIDKENKNSFLFLAAETIQEKYTRSEYAEMTRLINRHLPMPVVVIFYGEGKLNIAFAQRHKRKRIGINRQSDEKREILGKVSMLSNISCAFPHRGHLDILEDFSLSSIANTLGRKKEKNFNTIYGEWINILDVQVLNKRFYSELLSWFDYVRELIDDGKASIPTVGELTKEAQIIRLITRILFIWFIKEKGLVAEELFNEDEVSKLLKNYTRDNKRDGMSDYYRAVLQNLFFATLNTEIKSRGFSTKSKRNHRVFTKYRYSSMLADKNKLLALFDKTPFINGGLFDCLDSSENKGVRIDCFSDLDAEGKAGMAARAEKQRILHIPNAIFFDENVGLFSLLNRYKFTVEESTPIDQEVALDPELLGRVFENLLAINDPDTGTAARKANGSFYTPREVVDYMVNEALVYYLIGKVEAYDNDKEYLEERLRQLFDYSIADHLITDAEKKPLVEAIANIRIIDPAVGSGAFPMGIMQKLVMVLRRIDPDNVLWKLVQQEKTEKEISRLLSDEENRKRREMRLKEINDIFSQYAFSDYGRKLYLIHNNIYGVDIQPIACLISKLRFFITLAIEQKNEGANSNNYGIMPLPNLETRFLAADTLTPLYESLKARILESEKCVALKTKLKNNSENYFLANTYEDKKKYIRNDKAIRAELLTELKKLGFPEGEASRYAQWDVFDQNAHAQWFDSELMFGGINSYDVVIGNPPYVVSKDENLRRLYSESVKGRPNLYGFFIHRSIQSLCHSGSIVAFINPKTLLTDAYFGALRRWIISNAHVYKLINIVSRKNVFEEVLQSVIINFFVKEKKGISIKNINTKDELAAGVYHQIDDKHFIYGKVGQEIFLVADNMLAYQIMKKINAFPTLEEMRYSFVTGKLQWDKYKEVLSMTAKKTSTRVIWAENLQRYHFAENRLRLATYVPTKMLSQSSVEVDTIAVQRTTAVEQARRIITTLICPATMQQPVIFENHTSYLEGYPNQQELLFCLGLLCSKLYDFIFRHINSNTQVSAGELNQMPYPYADSATIKKTAAVVKKILRKNGNDTALLEAEIDQEIYKAFGLSKDEINLIEEVTR